MIRILTAAVVVFALLPASAEAAKFRFGGRSHSNSHAGQSQRDGSNVVVTPTLRSRQTDRTAAGQPYRAVAPAAVASAEPVALRSSQPEEARVWCRSQVVVGGFCMLN